MGKFKKDGNLAEKSVGNLAHVKDWKKFKKEKKEFKEKVSLKLIAQGTNSSVSINSTTSTSLGGRNFTVSLAVPGSILNNAQSPELRSYLTGQVARAAAIFKIDEVVIFDDECSKAMSKSTEGEVSGSLCKKGSSKDACIQMARILQYLECPQYLRKHFFPIHKDLEYCGLLNPTDMPHHLRGNERSRFREGVVVDRPVKAGSGSFVNIGLKKDVRIDLALTAGTRVTVELDDRDSDETISSKKSVGKVVSPHAPRLEDGLYWGYTVRLANGLSDVFQSSPWKKGYDVKVGTSEKGTDFKRMEIPSFKHLLIVFGGVKGLEFAHENDENLNSDETKSLFDLYVNTCPEQGSRTIRTEEAMLISLAVLEPLIMRAQT